MNLPVDVLIMRLDCDADGPGGWSRGGSV